MNWIRTKVLALVIALLFAGCETNEIEVSQIDNIKFEIGDNKYNYHNVDSTFHVCSESRGIQPEFDFVYLRTFKSESDDFQLMNLTVFNRSKECPLSELDILSEFTFTLTAINKSGKYVDYFNMGRMESLSWTQDSKDDIIIIKGQFEGWIFKYFSERPDEAIEPLKLDSLYIENGEFQFTLD